MIVTLTDAIRWWGAIAGLIGLADVIRWLRLRPRPRTASPVIPLLVTLSMGGLCLFLILMGTTIPLTTRVPGFSQQTPLFVFIVLVGWSMVSAAGWGFVTARAARPGMLGATAGLCLAAMTLAAFLTAPG